MMNKARGRAGMPDGHFEGPQAARQLETVTNIITQYFTRENVSNQCQVAKALDSSYVGYIRSPYLVRPGNTDL